jgi:hypothetical protein
MNQDLQEILNENAQVENQDSEFRSTADKAIRYGYYGAASRWINMETIRLFWKKSWHDAVNYNRSQWQYVKKELLANEFQEQPEFGKNLFFVYFMFWGKIRIPSR